MDQNDEKRGAIGVLDLSATHPVTPAMLFGVPIDVLTMEDTIDWIASLVDDGRRLGRSHQIATVNVDFLVNAIVEPDLKRLLQRSALNLSDGMPVVWASRLTGCPLPERVAGADLVPRLAAESGRRSLKIHFFGGGPGVADRATRLLLDRHPDAHITADEGPVIADPLEVDDSVIERINHYDADVLCVALGNPKQERFIAAHADRLGCPVMIGVGGTLDMLVGDKRRAPLWVQRIGAEFIVRAVQDPGRLGPRYARDVRVFGPHLFRHLRAVRDHRDGAFLTIDQDEHGECVRVAQRAPDAVSTAAAIARIGSTTGITFELESVRSLAPEGHGLLAAVVRAGERTGASFISSPAPSTLQACLADYGTLSWFESVGSDDNRGDR